MYRPRLRLDGHTRRTSSHGTWWWWWWGWWWWGVGGARHAVRTARGSEVSDRGGRSNTGDTGVWSRHGCEPGVPGGRGGTLWQGRAL